jgi:hypothetical protein
MNISLGKYAPYAKTIAAFLSLLVPFITAIATTLDDGAVSVDDVTMLAAAGGALIAGTKAVYEVTNKPAVK